MRRDAFVAGLVGLFSLLIPGAVMDAASSGLHVSAAWRGDFETGDLSQWTAVQAKDASRVTVQSAPVRQGLYAARFEVRPGDNGVAGSGTGERAEVYLGQAATDGYEGHEAYWAWSTYFPDDFTAPDGAWNFFVQFHHSGVTGQSNIEFDVRNNAKIGLRVMGGNFSRPARKDFILAPLKVGRWYDFVLHVRWSSRRLGFVEVWVNRRRVLRKTSTPTLYAGQGVYLKQGYYRSAYNATAVIYQDDMRRGSTFADVTDWASKPRIPE